jgi:1-acyl-sn-glycerol-3-phosphate acyltransferase
MPNKSFLSTVNLFIRSLVFSVFSITAIFLYSFILVFSMLLPLRYRYVLIRFFFRTYITTLRLICHIDYEIEGLENIPVDRNGVVLCKHQSTWETFLLPTLFHRFTVIAKRELIWVPFFGWGLAASDPITINRSDKSSAMQQILVKGKQCLEAGRWVLVYPEGTRTAPGKIGQYKLGGARLATNAGFPVIPIAHNAGRYWPRRSFIKQPGKIHVAIGPLIETKDRTPEEVLELAKNWIEEKMKQL